MSEDDKGGDSFEERFRWLAREVTRSVERLAELDVDEIARSLGSDAERARELADRASRWLSGQAEAIRNEVVFGEPGPGSATDEQETSRGAEETHRGAGETRRGAGPHPLDLPTEGQGLALSALDSGRWTVEPGSNLLVVHGEGPAPSDKLGLVGELRARDWIDANGEVTLVGRRALSRWSGIDPTG